MNYLLSIVEATRKHDAILLGVSPRGSLALMKSAQAFAAIHGRGFVTPDDIKTLLIPVLAHRMLLRTATSFSVTTHFGMGSGRAAELLLQIAESVPCPTESFTES
jgi:MoxR-like ATPase